MCRGPCPQFQVSITSIFNLTGWESFPLIFNLLQFQFDRMGALSLVASLPWPLLSLQLLLTWASNLWLFTSSLLIYQVFWRFSLSSQILDSLPHNQLQPGSLLLPAVHGVVGRSQLVVTENHSKKEYPGKYCCYIFNELGGYDLHPADIPLPRCLGRLDPSSQGGHHSHCRPGGNLL